MDKKLTFDEVVNSEWERTWPYDGTGPGIRIGEEGVIFTFETVWDEFRPLSHEMVNTDIQKLYNLLCNSNKMYNLIKKLDTEEAKQIINDIETSTEFPEK